MPQAAKTASTQQTVSPSSPSQQHSRTQTPRSWWIHVAILLGTLAFTALFLAQYDTPELLLLRYFAVFVISTTLPGVLMWRLLSSGGRGTLPDLAMGTGLGILLQLALWFIFVSFGIGEWLLLGSLLLLVPFIVVPKCRTYWVSAPQTERLPSWVTAALAACFSIALVRLSRTFTSALPPAANSWGYDQYWHLGNAASLLTRNHFIDMRVVHDPLNYHWLFSAHTASQALTTGLELPLLFTRMWILPLFALIIMIAAAIAKSLTGQWWPGVLFAAMIILTPDSNPTGVSVPFGSAMSVGSGSQIFAIVITLMILYMLIRFWQVGKFKVGEWLIFVALLAIAPGAKSSVLPVLICGLALGLLVSLIRRGNWKKMAVPFGVSAAVLLVVMPFLGDDGTGSKIKLLSTLRFADFYSDVLGLNYAESTFGGGILPLSMLTKLGLVATAVILLAYLLTFVWVIVGSAALRSTTGHEGGWVLLGMGIAGFVAMMVVDVGGMSQVYFLRMGVLGWYLLATWGLYLLSRGVSRPAAIAFSGTVIGVFTFTMTEALLPQFVAPERPVLALLIIGALLFAASIAIVASLMLTKPGPARNTIQFGGATALITASLLLPITSVQVVETPAPETGAVSTEEFEAADWLRLHSDPDEIIATNTHCWPEQNSVPCAARSFWVSGFTQRPVLVEGWAYTDAAHAARGVNGLGNSLQPFHDTELLQLNDAAFFDPSAETMAALREQGVTWLFAAQQRGDLADDIGTYATKVFSNEDVTIYRLD